MMDAHGKMIRLRGGIMPPKELWEAYSNPTVRPASCLVHISYIKDRNLVCGCIWDGGVSRTILGSLTLTSDLVSRNCIESGAYLLYTLR